MINSKMYSIKPLFLLMTLVAPLTLYAEEQLTTEVTVGVGHVDLSEDSAKFAEYTGLEEGGYFIGALNLSWMADARYWDVQIKDLGLDSRFVGIEGGEYNRYKIELYHDSTIHKLSTNARTPFSGEGSDVLTLPASLINSGINVGDMATLQANLRDIDLKVERRRDGVNAKLFLSNAWQGEFSIRQDQKEGLQSIGGAVGYRGFPSSAILPKPIDYITNEIEVGLNYASEKVQFQARYYFSTFANEYDSLTWDNPFIESGAPAFPSQGRLALEPDNQYHRLSLQGGVNFTNTTRLTAVLEHGLMTQDEDLLPYDVAGTTTNMPRNSAKAEVQTTLAKVKLSMRPVKRLRMNAQLRYDKNDNKTPVADFYRTIADYPTVTQQGPSQNHDFDVSKWQAKLNGSYYFGGGKTLKMGVEREETERTHRAVDRTVENSGEIKFNTRIDKQVSTSIGYQRAYRNSQGYDSGGLAHDNQRQLDIADRDSERFEASVTMLPTLETTLAIYANTGYEQLDDQSFGLLDNKSHSLTIDLSHSPKQGMNYFMFATHEVNNKQQDGREYTNGATEIDPTYNWQVLHDEVVNTVGLGMKLKFWKEKLKVNANLSRALAISDLSYSHGASLTSSDVPNLRNRRDQISLSGEYQVSDAMDLLLGYRYEHYLSDDWYRDGLDAADVDSDRVLLLSGPTNDYFANIIYTAIRYHW